MLTVSIVTYNTPDDELHGILASLRSPEVEKVFIVDNSRRPETEKIAREAGALYIPSDNRGYGAGHNQAIRRAMQTGSDYHLVVNSDISFEPWILSKMTAYMNSHPDVGALHPDVRNPDGTRQYTARLLPTPWDLFGRRFLPSFLFKRRNRRYTLQNADLSKPLNVPYFQGSFMFLRMAALKRTGLFDERFFMYPEDIDLVRRLHASWKTLYWPEARVTHDHHASSYHSLRMLRIHIGNMWRYFNKWGWWRDGFRRNANKTLLRQISSQTKN